MSSGRLIRWFLLLGLLLPLLIAGCGTRHATSEPAAAVPADAVCAVCGMYLRDAPGPRAQAWETGAAKPLFFDSIRDFFAWALQPEHQHATSALYVQNSALIDWQHPTNAANSFIDARHAYYVAWQPLSGSMGPTLAPFATREAAESFVTRHGGAVFDFNQITPDLIAGLTGQCPPATTFHALSTCRAPSAAAAHKQDGILPVTTNPASMR